MRNQLEFFDHAPAHVAKANRTATSGPVRQLLVLGVIVRFNTAICAKAVRKVDGQAEEYCQVLAEKFYILLVPCVRKTRHSAQIWDRRTNHHRQEILTHLVDGSVVTNQCGEIIANFVSKIWNSIEHLLCTWQKRATRCPQRSNKRPNTVLGSCALTITAHAPFASLYLNRKLNRKFRDFVQEQPDDNTRVSFAIVHRLLMLLSRNSCRLLGDLSRSLGGAVSEHRYHSRGHCCSDTYTNGSPVGHVPPVHCERAHRHRVIPLSMLEPILP